MATCLICLRAEPADTDEGRYHVACLRSLFRTETAPRIKFDLAHFPTRIVPELGKMSISGMQRKALVRLSNDKQRILVATKSSRFILKPQIERYVHVPENEHVSMRIAELAGVRVPRFGLFHLADQSLAYLVQRYDRIPGKPPRKLNQIDFCQLSGRQAKDRGFGTAEECAALVARFTGSPLGELHRLYRQLVVAYWIGNGDMHLKNLSLLAREDGTYALSPACGFALNSALLPFDHPVFVSSSKPATRAPTAAGHSCTSTRRAWHRSSGRRPPCTGCSRSEPSTRRRRRRRCRDTGRRGPGKRRRPRQGALRFR